MSGPNDHVPFIWSIAELLRGKYRKHEYGRVVLPFTLLRRLDQVLEPTKPEVLAQVEKYKGRDMNLDPLLRRASGQSFYNVSNKTLASCHSDAEHVHDHLLEYIGGFNKTVREIFEAFEFEATLVRLEKAEVLYLILGKFLDKDLDLRPETVPPSEMGDIFEGLIHKFSEASNASAGDHFTPREVVRLCAEMVLAGDEELRITPGIIRTVYDPACGTGGMLSVMDEVVRELNPAAKLKLFGQEMNPESWAICRAEMLLKGQDPDNIAPLSTLSADGHSGRRFDFMLANPPFGVDWSADHEKVSEEHEELGFSGRFGPKLPSKDDGSLLFLLNMLAKRKSASEDRGSRMAIIFNASPLFTGTAVSGESATRKFILENDLLEAIVALPEQLFYNTGIFTYLWVLSSNKEGRRKQKVQLIDARRLYGPMKPKSLGYKRRRLDPEHIEQIRDLYHSFEADGQMSKVLDVEEFGYRQVTIDRPLRLRYRAGEAAVEALQATGAYTKASAAEQKKLVQAIWSLNGLDSQDSLKVTELVKQVWEGKLLAPQKKLLLGALAVKDPTAPPAVSGPGKPYMADSALRERERVPLVEDVQEYFDREVVPFVEDAWVAEADGPVGYDIPIGRIFHKYTPLPPLAEVDAELAAIEEEIQRLLAEVTH